MNKLLKRAARLFKRSLDHGSLGSVEWGRRAQETKNYMVDMSRTVSLQCVAGRKQE